MDGPVGDLDDISEIGYPVFARSVIPFTARGRIGELGWNEPVVIGGVQVRPGDLVIADKSGAVFVSAAEEDTRRRSAGCKSAAYLART